MPVGLWYDDAVTDVAEWPNYVAYSVDGKSAAKRARV